MVFTLSITSWADRFKGAQLAEHYYGRVKFDNQEIDLEHEVEIKDPAYEDSSLRCYLAKPGEKMITSRFVSKEEIIEKFREFLWSEAKPTDIIGIVGKG